MNIAKHLALSSSKSNHSPQLEETMRLSSSKPLVNNSYDGRGKSIEESKSPA